MDFAPLFNLNFCFRTNTLVQNGVALLPASIFTKTKTPFLNSITTCEVLTPPATRGSRCESIQTSPSSTEVGWSPVKVIELDHIDLGETLKPDEVFAVKEIIKNNYDSFSKNKYDIGLITLEKHRIQLTNDSPIYQRPYRTNPKDSKEINTQITELLNKGIIRTSYSSFASPVTLANKKGLGKTRLCIDFRKLNDRIMLDRNPIPRIDTLLDHFSTAKYFSTLDITKAYYHIELEPDSINKTAFVTNQGQYEFVRVPFGLKNAPMCFQRAISRVFRKHNLTNTLNYFDDVIVYSDTLKQHLYLLSQLLTAFSKENIKLNLDKCHFAKTQVSFLGYLVSHRKIEPHPSNLNAISRFPKPTCVKELQRFLGMVNVYNKFIPEYSKLRNPLNQLLKKGYLWRWSESCDNSYEKLKGALIRGPILAIYSADKPCFLFTDASGRGIGAVLKQPADDGTLHPIAYHSRSLHSYEQQYTVSEMECLAMVDSITKFHHYLYSQKFTVFSDHAPLKWLKSIKQPSGRLFRWSVKLSQYEFDIRHTSGRTNIQPDCLSRAPVVSLLTIEELHLHNPPSSSQVPEIPTVNKKGLIKVIVPPDLRVILLQRCHETFGHPGVKKMRALLSPYYFWQEMMKDITDWAKQCDICQRNKTMPFPKFGLLQALPPAEKPFDLLSIDTIGGFINYGSNKSYIHLIIDHATRFIWTFASKSQTTQTYISSLTNIFSIMKPKALLSDRAPAFLSSQYKHFLEKHGVKQLLTSSHHPQCNGLNERTNRTIVERLKCRRNDPFYNKITWPNLLQQVTLEYNHSPHATTMFTPAYLLFGILPFEPPLFQQKPIPNLEEARRLAFQNINKSHDVSKHRYDKKFRPSTFKVNDLVLMETHKQVNLNKLTPVCHGPYRVIRQVSPTNYELDKPNQVLNRQSEIVHSSKLRLYINPSSPPPGLQRHEQYTLPILSEEQLPVM